VPTKEQKKAIRASLERVAQDVADLPRAPLRALVPVLKAAETEVEAELRRWLSTVNGADTYTAQRHRAVLVQLKLASRVAGQKAPRPKWLRNIQEQMLDSLATGGLRAANMSIRHLMDQIALYSGMFGGAENPLPIKQAAILAEGKKMMIPRFAKSVSTYGGQVFDDIKTQLAIGVVRQETIHQLTNRLMRISTFKPPISRAGDDPSVYADEIAKGLFMRYRYKAERIVRTEVINAYNETAAIGITEANQHDPAIRKRWDATNDMRVCRICASLHGEVVKVDHAFSTGVMAPPQHPNCRCAVIAWSPTWTE